MAPKKQKVLSTENVLDKEAGLQESNVKTGNQKNNSIYMIFGIILAGAVIAMLLFSQKQGNLDFSNKMSGEAQIKSEVKNGNTIKVDYVGKLEDGTIFDSSIEEFAKKAPDYNATSGRKYEPLEFTVGAGQMIKGFDNGVIGMKSGEKKTIKIAPKDAYGEAMTTQSVPMKYLSDNIEQEVPVESFQDKIKRSFPADSLGDKKDIKVGEILDSEGIKGTVVSRTATGVEIEIENTSNPFYGKKLKVGLKADYQGNEITIKNITDTQVAVNILNKTSPFYGKKIVAGLEGKLPNGQDIKIVKIDGDNVEVAIPNTHKLAGKTLIFDVEVKEIK